MIPPYKSPLTEGSRPKARRGKYMELSYDYDDDILTIRTRNGENSYRVHRNELYENVFDPNTIEDERFDVKQFYKDLQRNEIHTLDGHEILKVINHARIAAQGDGSGRSNNKIDVKRAMNTGNKKLKKYFLSFSDDYKVLKTVVRYPEFWKMLFDLSEDYL